MKSSTPRIPPLVILKTGSTRPQIAAVRGDFEHWFYHALKLDPSRALVVHATRAHRFPPLEHAAGILITGSDSMVTDRHEWSEWAAAWLLAAFKRGIPILGVCYGHQLLAHALGGIVDFNPRGPEVGTRAVHLTAVAGYDALLGGLPSTLFVNSYHSQSVIAPPRDAIVLASNEHDACQAFVMGECAWGLQFHPEFDGEIMRAYIHADRDLLLATGRDPDLLHRTCGDTPCGPEILSRFAAFVERRARARAASSRSNRIPSRSPSARRA